MNHVKECIKKRGNGGSPLFSNNGIDKNNPCSSLYPAVVLRSVLKLDVHTMTPQEKIEYKRLRNRLAARKCRTRKQERHKKELFLTEEIDGITKAYATLIVEKYQLECRMKQTQDQNESLQQHIERLRRQLKHVTKSLVDATAKKEQETAKTKKHNKMVSRLPVLPSPLGGVVATGTTAAASPSNHSTKPSE